VIAPEPGAPSPADRVPGSGASRPNADEFAPVVPSQWWVAMGAAEEANVSGYAERYGWVAEQFTTRVRAVPAGRWDEPAPCEGWVARDVVGHLVDWLPGFFFDRWGVAHADPPAVETDPVGAWEVVDGAVRAAFADPAVADRVVEETPMGPQSFAACFDQIGTTDVFLHTWDLARATGQDETLDAGEVHRLLAAMEPYDEMLRTSGHYGPRVAVPDDADEQTRLLAFIGRRP
jgi:uncharacterized protein (TIGR03086 family)